LCAAPISLSVRSAQSEESHIRTHNQSECRPVPLSADDAPVAEPVFSLTDVRVTFGGLVALRDVSLDLAAHQVLGIIGPNGAGKTTLFNVACGFVKPDTGSIRWRGEQLARLRPDGLADLRIARTLQGLGLFGRMTVLENVMVGAQRHARTGFASALLALPRAHRDERALRDRAVAVLEELHAAQFADRLPDSLPYAVRKRVALARALVSEPELLLLDEPASGLSSDEMDELSGVIRALTERMSIMLVEHHMDLVMKVCDRITVLDFGRVIATGTPDQIRNDPAVMEAYLGDEVDDEAVSALAFSGSDGDDARGA
jgi:branched-chain amino acid transport system ATP-binding protein